LLTESTIRSGRTQARQRSHDGPTQLTFIGAMVEEEGTFDLLEIAVILGERKKKFILTPVGEGTEAELARFDRTVRERGLTGQVRRRGVSAATMLRS
jgi:hypothetical protein